MSGNVIRQHKLQDGVNDDLLQEVNSNKEALVKATDTDTKLNIVNANLTSIETNQTDKSQYAKITDGMHDLDIESDQSMPVTIKSPLESNGGIPVNIQDQTTELQANLFNQSISNFTLAADTNESTETTLYYTFTATGGHGISVGNEILLLDVVGDRALQSVVTNVATNVITIDRPIDNVYPSATALGRIVTSNMAVDGSSTPQIFTYRAGTNEVDVTRILITMLGGSTAMDDGKFGNITALTNGLVFRVYNSYHKTIYNFKTNQDIKQFCYDVTYSDNAPAGSTGLSSRITFAGQDKHGVVIRVSGNTVIQFIVQDDLTGLTSVKASVEGHRVTN